MQVPSVPNSLRVLRFHILRSEQKPKKFEILALRFHRFLAPLLERTGAGRVLGTRAEPFSHWTHEYEKWRVTPKHHTAAQFCPLDKRHNVKEPGAKEVEVSQRNKRVKRETSV